jgi:DNA repair exonuclease SbcCD ATPase subunit
MIDSNSQHSSAILQKLSTDSNVEHKSAKYYEEAIRKLKQELAEKNQIIKELTARLDTSIDRGSEVNQSLSKQSTPIPLR